MAKKLNLLMAAVAILAFATPSVANASKLTVGGSLVAVGAKITGKSTSARVALTTALLSTLECEHVELKGELTKNDGTTVEGTGSGEGTQSGCTRSGSPITVSDTTLTKIVSSTSGSGTVNFTTKVTINLTNCSFTGTSVPFTYTSDTDSIVFTEAKGITSAGCGAAKLDGTFTLETTSGGTSLTFD